MEILAPTITSLIIYTTAMFTALRTAQPFLQRAEQVRDVGNRPWLVVGLVTLIWILVLSSTLVVGALGELLLSHVWATFRSNNAGTGGVLVGLLLWNRCQRLSNQTSS